MTQVAKLRRSLGYKKSDFVILFVGRLAQEKNIEFLLKMMQIVKRNNKNIKLLFVGDGPDKEKYEADAKVWDVEEITLFAGRVPLTEMPLYYHCCDLFVTASITETQGLTVIEALAASKPVVCIEDEAFHTMVTEGVNGRFFATERGCAEIIEELAHDKNQYLSLSKAARNSIKKYSLSSFATSVLEVYQVAIKNFNNKKDFSSIVRRVFKNRKEKKEKNE